MSMPVRCSRPTDRWRIGGNYSAIPLPSLPCLIGCYITDMCSNAGPAVGAQKLTCRQRMRRSKTTLSRPLSLAGFELITEGDDTTLPLQKKDQQLHGDAFQFQGAAIAAQFERVAIEFEFVEMVARAGHGAAGRPTFLTRA